jgi:exopolyphosphatase/guanosine-5'-triphosphate,3'-diphosphate pyrophosphatase
MISHHKISFVKAVGTSALREASNADVFIDTVFSETGIPIEVISGEREAELTMKGISFSLIGSCFESRPLFIMDIGGGSTEWIFSQKNSPFIKGSIPVGVVKLARDYNMSDGPLKPDTSRMQKLFIGFLRDIQKTIGHLQEQTHFIGTAGTFTTLASIDLALEKYSRDKIHLHTISIIRLKKIYTKLSTLSLRDRKHVRGLEPERADLIIPGLHFTINAMDFFHFKELTVSDYGLLEGVLIELRDSVKKNISAARKP